MSKGRLTLKSGTGKQIRLHRSTVTCCAAVLTLLAGWCAAEDVRGSVSLGELPQGWHDDGARDLALTELRGHRVVLTMAYAACHRLCPTTMDEFKRMQRVFDAHGE